ncbi:hypothetical protein GCM10010272_35460 [Streptomyces lateritius]|nr:hypothetical protein GCM10010272_35460 [Streptomyces lateritius]
MVGGEGEAQLEVTALDAAVGDRVVGEFGDDQFGGVGRAHAPVVELLHGQQPGEARAPARGREPEREIADELTGRSGDFGLHATSLAPSPYADQRRRGDAE